MNGRRLDDPTWPANYDEWLPEPGVFRPCDTDGVTIDEMAAAGNLTEADE